MAETASRRVSRGITAVSAVAAGYYLVFGGSYTWSDIRGLTDEAAQRAGEVASLQLELASVRALGDSLESDAWVIERVARERYSFIRSGELLFRFVEPSEPGSPVGARE